MKKKLLSKPQSALLDTVFSAGGTQALFGVLKHWPKSDLKLLLKELEEFFAWGLQELEAGREVEMFQPQNFFSDKLSKKMNTAFDMAGFELAGITGEIASVAMFYLDAPASEEKSK